MTEGNHTPVPHAGETSPEPALVERRAGATSDGHAKGAPRELTRLTIAAALLVVAALGSTVAAGLPHADGDAPGLWLAPHDEVLRTGPVSMRSVHSAHAGAPATGTAYRLLGELQPLDASLHLAGLEPPADTFPAPELWERQEPVEAHRGRVYVDVRTLLRRGRSTFAWRVVEDSAEAQRERLEATPSLFPTRGYISSGFTRSRRHPILALTRQHKGLDIVAPTGTPIVAAARGRVQFAGTHGEYGRMVEIDHGYGVVTRYAHASRVLVRRGELVDRGDTIARVGRTGLAIGSHLHYEVLVNGVAANPNRYVFDLNVIPD